MSFFLDVQALWSVQKIKKGGRAKLSVSQITGLIICLPDAKNNLSAQKFGQVYQLFNQFRANNTKTEMDLHAYLQEAAHIIDCFDAIAPYEKYCGQNNKEFLFLLEDIRAENGEGRPPMEEYVNNEKETYAKRLVEQSNAMVSLEDARQFTDILLLSSVSGKNDTLNAFDDFVDGIVKKYGAIPSITIVSFFMGALNANEIITQAELDAMRKNFTSELLKSIKPGY